jgi:glyoxylase-like metal-dependent hydrolase (beta-lactamase superfamily II)
VIQVGDITVSRVVEYDGPLFMPTELLPDAKSAALEAELGWLVPRHFDPASGMLVNCVQSFAFRTRHHAILVDTCVGNGKTGRRKPQWNGGDWPFLDNLKAAGFAPEDIDFVVLTHIHVDHVGWNTRLVDGRWVPTFPNAKYLIVRDELRAFEAKAAAGGYPQAIYDDSLKPVLDAGQAVLVASDHELDDSVRLSPSPGHTPAHVCVAVRSKGAEAVISGDVLHHPLQRLHPDWNSRACDDAGLAHATRRRLLESCCDRDVVVLASHFDPCRIVAKGEAFAFEDV